MLWQARHYARWNIEIVCNVSSTRIRIRASNRLFISRHTCEASAPTAAWPRSARGYHGTRTRNHAAPSINPQWHPILQSISEQFHPISITWSISPFTLVTPCLFSCLSLHFTCIYHCTYVSYHLTSTHHSPSHISYFQYLSVCFIFISLADDGCNTAIESFQTDRLLSFTVVIFLYSEYLPPVTTRVSLTYWSMQPSKLSSPLWTSSTKDPRSIHVGVLCFPRSLLVFETFLPTSKYETPTSVWSFAWFDSPCNYLRDLYNWVNM